MRLSNYYNFKNTIKFFIDIDNLDYRDVQIDKRSWSEPFAFRIRKNQNSFRTLQIPNIYNFKVAYEYYKTQLSSLGLDFEKLEELDDHKRMKISYELGEFKENSYNEWQLDDYNKLIEYDYLLRYDIKSYYENIYTHYILNDKTTDKNIDKPLSHMYNGRTAGIIMGNYISLYMAELLSVKISKLFEQKLKELNIDCYFSYFSDDFYIFLHKNDLEKVTDIFDKVLEKFGLSKNDDKIKKYDYLEYSNDDKLEKYWKIITRKCKNQQYYQNLKIVNGKLKQNNNLFFTNQIIYRLNKLDDYRLKKVFVVNFFKSEFFRSIDFSNTYIDEYNYHQILFLIKEFPEIVLYIDSIINSFDLFKKDEFKKIVVTFFEKSLNKSFHDEQLYYFYLIYKIDGLDMLKNDIIKEKVLETNNFILISYYLKEHLFDDSEISIIKSYDEEKYWLVFYYLILLDSNLYSDLENSIMRYLIPKNASNHDSINAYKNFYLSNLSQKNEILIDLDKIEESLNDYFKLKNKLRNIDEEE